MERLFQLHWGQYVAGMIVEDGIVTTAAPCLKWAINKPLQQVIRWRKLEKIYEIKEDQIVQIK